MTKTISALKARRNLGELLDRAYYRGEDTIIEKKGKPIAKISSIKAPKTLLNDPLAETAGIWKELDTESLKRKVKEGRRDESSKKKFLADW